MTYNIEMNLIWIKHLMYRCTYDAIIKMNIAICPMFATVFLDINSEKIWTDFDHLCWYDFVNSFEFKLFFIII